MRTEAAAKRLEVTAQLLAEGHEPDEIDDALVLDRALAAYIAQAAEWVCSVDNIERGDPRWYVAHRMKDHLHAGLYGLVTSLLRAPAPSPGDGEPGA